MVADGELLIRIENLRNSRGLVHVCLTKDRRRFPDCGKDPEARKLSWPTSKAGVLTIDRLSVGRYALSVIHDENGNGRLDSFAKIPREGFGFSRNPKIRFGPPSYQEVEFAVDKVANSISVRMRYLL